MGGRSTLGAVKDVETANRDTRLADTFGVLLPPEEVDDAVAPLEVTIFSFFDATIVLI